MEHLIPAMQLLLIPTVGLLWRISGQLSELAAKTEAHAGRLDRLENRLERGHS